MWLGKGIQAWAVSAVVFLLLGLFAAGNAQAASRYHVSYLWHHDLNRVQQYRQKVGGVLGRQVASNLKVVAKKNLFGLIYWRRGDYDGAVRAAKVHSRLLNKRGLPKAAVMAQANWTVLEVGKAKTTATPPKAETQSVTQAEPQTRRQTMSETDKRQEVHNLEQAIETYIDGLRQQGKLAADERTGWSVFDFTTGEKLVTINEDIQFQAASLIKPFVAVAFFHRVKNGDFIYGRKSRYHMRRMIQRSDNRSTNWIMRQVGGPAAVQRILQQHYPDIFPDTRIVEYIPAGGKTYRNKASAHDYSRFLYALWNKDVPKANEIRRLMALPGSDRIFHGATAIPAGTRVYNKTGSTSRLCGDMGILVVKGPDGKNYPYTVVGIIEKQEKARNYTAWIRSRGDIIRNVSSIVYKGIIRHHASGAT